MKKINQILSKKFVIYAKNNFFDIDNSREDMFINYRRVRGHCHYTGKYRGSAYNICNLKHEALKEILIVFHNGYTYDYHFIIKELAKEIDGQFECLGENTEKIYYFFCAN